MTETGASRATRFPEPKVRRVSSADQVASAIRAGILSGRLARGDRLTQDEIADQLGLSRIPVREAMITLDREGWVRSESSRGAFVTGLEADDVRDHYALRGIVFGLLADRTTTAIDAAGRDELGRQLRALRSAPDVASFTATNEVILRTIIRTAGSARFTAALRVMPSIVPDDFFDVVPGSRRIQERGLSAVVRAVRAEEPAVAAQAMREVLHGHGDAVVRAFEQRGLMNDRTTVVESSWLRPGPGTSADVVAAHVRELIFHGSLQQGQRLPQDEVAEAVGVSRIPVREAIIALEREGWVRVEPHRGAYVNGLDDQVVTDHFTLYGSYFGFAAQRAIQRMTPDAGERLATLAVAVAGARTAVAMEAASTRYLRCLLSTAASNRLGVVLRSMPQLVPGHFFAVVPGSIKAQRAGVPAMQAAIAAGDLDGAAAASLDLQRRQGLAVAKVVRRHGGGAR